MINRTFLTKCNTIFQDSDTNFGLNPIAKLHKGQLNSRFLIQFDTDAIKGMVEDGIYTDKTKLKHTLKMYNCGSIDTIGFNRTINGEGVAQTRFRATSFDIVAFRIRQEWDRGRGFDHSDALWFNGNSAVSNQGSNWFQATDEFYWEHEGIMSDEELAMELDKFNEGEDSLVVATQHFDFGNEDLSLDITDYVNSIVYGDEILWKEFNRGLCIAYSPYLEIDPSVTLYTGFFSDKTNTFYEPVVESRYDEYIFDARNNFKAGKDNRLYLCPNINGTPCDLDNTPTCSIDGKQCNVVKQFKGVYYANVNIPNGKYEDETILVDTWDNITMNGQSIIPLDQEFILTNSLSFSNNKTESINEYVNLSGVKNCEKVNKGEKREISVTFKKAYENTIVYPDDVVYYRIYIKDAYREVDIIDWDYVNVTKDGNSFTIDTNGLLPQEYHVDIKYKNKYFNNELRFKVVNRID